MQNLQLLIVTTDSWESHQGCLRLFERSNISNEWRPTDPSFPVVVGKAGLAWGIGLHPPQDGEGLSKVEGDLKSPAGIFSIGTAFGFAPLTQMRHLKLDYLHLDEFIEAVDDPLSRYYNSVVNRKMVVPDWKSSEKMRSEPLYEIGLCINHNCPKPQPGKGSAIFFHLWRNAESGTAGCTAMARENLEKILGWLDKNKNPTLIQLPSSIYSKWQENENLKYREYRSGNTFLP